MSSISRLAFKAALLFALVLCFGAAPPAEACGGCWRCEWHGDHWHCYWICAVSVTPMDEPDRVLLSIDNYLTEAMEADQAVGCIAGFGPIKGIDSVNALTMREMKTGEPIAGYSFSSHDRPGSEFARLAHERGYVSEPNGDTWLGFMTSVSQDVPAGIPVSIELDVTLKEGTNLLEFVSTLREHSLVGTGAGNPDGTINADHFQLLPIREVDVSIQFPAQEQPAASPTLEGKRVVD